MTDPDQMAERDVAWIIDGDGHATEPDDMWDRFLAEPYRSVAPRLGTTSLPRSDDSSERARHAGNAKMLSIGGGQIPSRRLPDMDVDLIEKAVVFPTLGLLTAHVSDPQASLALHRAANDWMAEYCGFDRARIFGVGGLPSTNAEDALAEARRCVEELGFCAVFQHPPLLRGTIPVHDRAFEPLWEYLESVGVPVVSHSGAPPPYAISRYPDFIASHAVHFVAEAMMTLTSFVLYGVLERHPGLRLGLVEAGAMWAWGYCHRLDEHVEKATTMVEQYALPEGITLSMLPSEYFRRQCFVTVEEEK